jgi:hypothetical protein
VTIERSVEVFTALSLQSSLCRILLAVVGGTIVLVCGVDRAFDASGIRLMAS